MAIGNGFSGIVNGIKRASAKKVDKDREVSKNSHIKKTKMTKLSSPTIKALSVLLGIYIISLSVIYASGVYEKSSSESSGFSMIFNQEDNEPEVPDDEIPTHTETSDRLTGEYLASVESAADEFVSKIEESISQEVAKPNESPIFLSSKTVFPANGEITSGYANRRNPFYIKNTSESEFEFHTGIDIAVPVGSSVFAYSDGTVTEASVSKKDGNFLIISHGEYETVYTHLSTMVANKGDTVKAGDTIAFSGDTGRTVSPHLHFEVRVNGTHTDPIKYLKQ